MRKMINKLKMTLQKQILMPDICKIQNYGTFEIKYWSWWME